MLLPLDPTGQCLGPAVLLSISGVGEVLAGLVLSELPGTDILRSSAQAVAYVELNPRLHRSGSSIDRPTRISKIGNAPLRNALYMPALSAMRHNPVVAALATRLKAQGRLKGKQIAVAAMRKLLVLCFGVLKSRKPFDPAPISRVEARGTSSSISQSHPFVRSRAIPSSRPMQTGCPSRTAAVKNGRSLSGHRRRVLDGCEHDGSNGWRWADERHSVTTTFSCQRTRYLPRPPSTGAEAPREMVADEETTIRRGPHEEYPRGTANGT